MALGNTSVARPPGLKIGGLKTGRIGIGEIKVGGLKVDGGLKINGDLITGGLRVEGDLRVGGIRVGGLETGRLGIGSLRIGGLRIGGLRVGGLKTGSLTTGGLGRGNGGKTVGKVNIKRDPVYHEVIYGVEPTGARHLEVDWHCDKWGRRIRTVGAWSAKVNGIEWTPETWDQFIPEDGSIYDEGTVYPQRGTLGTDDPDHLTWAFKTEPHSLGTELGFDVPDETGRVRTREIATLPVASGETADHLIQADAGQTIFPDYGEGWLAPAP